MGNLVKWAFGVAALGTVILLISWYVMRENRADMVVQEAEFNRDWNESMAMFAESKQQKQVYQRRAIAAQGRYSSAIISQREQAQKLNQHEQSIDKAVGEIEAD